MILDCLLYIIISQGNFKGNGLGLSGSGVNLTCWSLALAGVATNLIKLLLSTGSPDSCVQSLPLGPVWTNYTSGVWAKSTPAPCLEPDILSECRSSISLALFPKTGSCTPIPYCQPPKLPPSLNTPSPWAAAMFTTCSSEAQESKALHEFLKHHYSVPSCTALGSIYIFCLHFYTHFPSSVSLPLWSCGHAIWAHRELFSYSVSPASRSLSTSLTHLLWLWLVQQLIEALPATKGSYPTFPGHPISSLVFVDIFMPICQLCLFVLSKFHFCRQVKKNE